MILDTSSAEWAARMALMDGRVSDSRVEVINPDGTHLADITPDALGLTCNGANSEQWDGSISFVGPALWPHDDTDLLSPLSGNRIRAWWREHVPALGGWGEVLLCTLDMNDPDGTAAPGITWSMQLDDPLAKAKRGGYAGQTINVGGMTVKAALEALFGAVAPHLVTSFPESTTVLPQVYNLGTNDPDEDWDKIAALDGMVVRSTREGGVTALKTDASTSPVVDWSEGDHCQVSKLQRTVTTSKICNLVMVKSSSSAVIPVITATKMDTVSGSATCVDVYGPYPMTVESDAIATQAAADTLAAKTLADNLRPTDVTRLTVPARPDLEPGDLASLALADLGVAGEYRIESLRFDCPKAGADPGLMEVTMASRAA